MLRNNKPGEQEEIIEPVAGTLCSHVTRGGSRNIVGGGGVHVFYVHVFGTAEPVAGRLYSHVIEDGSWLWLLRTQRSWLYCRGMGGPVLSTYLG